MTRALKTGLLGDCEMRNSLKEKMLQHLHIHNSKAKGRKDRGRDPFYCRWHGTEKEEVEKRCSCCELPRLDSTFASTFSALEARSREWNVMDGVPLLPSLGRQHRVENVCD